MGISATETRRSPGQAQREAPEGQEARRPVADPDRLRAAPQGQGGRRLRASIVVFLVLVAVFAPLICKVLDIYPTRQLAALPAQSTCSTSTAPPADRPAVPRLLGGPPARPRAARPASTTSPGCSTACAPSLLDRHASRPSSASSSASCSAWSPASPAAGSTGSSPSSPTCSCRSRSSSARWRWRRSSPRGSPPTWTSSPGPS